MLWATTVLGKLKEAGLELTPDKLNEMLGAGRGSAKGNSGDQENK